MWTPDDVRLRFVEAAKVERRTPRGSWGPSTKVGFWPEFSAEFSDVVNWDAATLRDMREARNNRRKPPSPNEISRANEVLCEWTPLIPDDRRKLVWYWAHSAAGGVKFAIICKRLGWARRTAYDRLDRLFEQLAAGFVNISKTLRLADDITDCSLSGFGASIGCTLEELPETKSPLSWADQASGDQPEIRDFDWAAKQVRREARRRAKAEAGMPQEQSEAI